MTPSPSFTLRAVANNADPQLLGGIGVSDTGIALKSGHGAELPTILTGDCSSTGDGQTLNDTGALASVAVGDIIENVTDGSFAVVLVAGTNSITTTPLVKGSDNTWQSGDIWAVGRFVCTLTQLDADGQIVKQERVLVTAHTAAADSITVSRSFGGDTALTFDANDYAWLAVEKTYIEELQKAVRHILFAMSERDRGSRDYAAATNSSNDYTVNLSPKFVTLADMIGKPVVWKVPAACTGASNLNLNGTGLVSIRKEGGATTLATGDLATDEMVITVYNGTYHILINPVANAPSSGGITVTAKTADYSVVSGDSPGWFSNSGATDTISFTLPTPAIGKSFGFTTYGPFMKIVRGTSTHIIYDWDGADMLDLICSGGRGSNIELLGISTTEWQVVRQSGGWQMRGYIAGGCTTNSSANTTALIDRMLMVDDTISALSSSIQLNTASYGLTSSSHMTKGFFFGGIRTDDNGYNVINEMIYGRTEVCRLHQKTMATNQGSWATTVTSYVNQKSYLCGGYGTGSSTNVISKWPWGTEVCTNLAATMTDATSVNTNGYHSATKGYVMSGDTNATDEDALTYSTEACAALGVTITSRTARAGAIQSGLKGWSFGGGASLTSGDIWTFATEAKANSTASLGTGVHTTTGISGPLKGYICGGKNGTTVKAEVDNITYATDTRAANASNLSAARRDPCGMAPKF